MGKRRPWNKKTAVPFSPSKQTRLATSDKGSYYNQDEWLENDNETHDANELLDANYDSNDDSFYDTSDFSEYNPESDCVSDYQLEGEEGTVETAVETVVECTPIEGDSYVVICPRQLQELLHHLQKWRKKMDDITK